MLSALATAAKTAGFLFYLSGIAGLLSVMGD
jgi:hypothetical protein